MLKIARRQDFHFINRY